MKLKNYSSVLAYKDEELNDKKMAAKATTAQGSEAASGSSLVSRAAKPRYTRTIAHIKCGMGCLEEVIVPVDGLCAVEGLPSTKAQLSRPPVKRV